MIISQLLESSSSSSASLFLLLFLELELDFSYRILYACICNLRFERIRGASSDPPHLHYKLPPNIDVLVATTVPPPKKKN